MSIQLWPHQVAAVNTAEEAINEGRGRGLWVMPPGSGRTVAFAALAARLNRPVMVLLHRRERLQRTVDAFARTWPAAQVATLPGNGAEVAHVVVATGQSLPRDRFGLIVADEVCHAVAGTWEGVLDRFRPVFALGCTATPVRLDREGVEDLFGGVLYEYPADEALNTGAAGPSQQPGVFSDVRLAGRGRKRRAGPRTGRGTRSGCRSS
jgi:superfamily II DNA or RNA helicase